MEAMNMEPLIENDSLEINDKPIESNEILD